MDQRRDTRWADAPEFEGFGTRVASLPEPSPAALARESAAEPEVIAAKACAALLQVNIKTLYSMVARGESPGARWLGRALRFHRPTVIAWMAEGQGRAPRKRSAR
jgi:excisionase family DNA binding protein